MVLKRTSMDSCNIATTKILTHNNFKELILKKRTKLTTSNGKKYDIDQFSKKISGFFELL